MANTPATTVDASGSYYIDMLLYGVKWDSYELTYSFPTDASFYDYHPSMEYGGSNELLNDRFVPLYAEWQEMVRGIFSGISKFTNLKFTEITETETEHADFRIASTSTTGQAFGWAYPPTAGNVYYGLEGDVFLAAPKIGTHNLDLKNEHALYVLTHEIAHALGLSHPNNSVEDFPIDSVPMRETVMDTMGVFERIYNLPMSYQRNDIAAMQYLYGANFGTNAGNTDYVALANGSIQIFENGLLKETINAGGELPLFHTIWDGNGTDTFYFDQLSSNQYIDLRPGQGSIIGGDRADLIGEYAANIYNAYLHEGDERSLIENVFTGSGNDIIVTNQADNIIDGGDGYDIVVIDALFDANWFYLNLSSLSGQNVNATWSYDPLTLANGITILDAEHDLTGFEFGIRGSQGWDWLAEVEEIRFRDKVVHIDFNSSGIALTVDDYTLGSRYEGDWWQQYNKSEYVAIPAPNSDGQGGSTYTYIAVNNLLSAVKWASNDLTFSFPSSASYYGAGYEGTEPDQDFVAFGTIEQNKVRYILKQIASVTGLTFTEIAETGSQHANIRFGYSSAGSKTYGPSEKYAAGDIWFNIAMLQTLTGPEASIHLLIREIGHALGLKDAGEYSSYLEYNYGIAAIGWDWGGIDDTNMITSEIDASQLPKGLQRNDIAALQHMYGANYNKNAKDQTQYIVQADGSLTVIEDGQGYLISAGGDHPLYQTIWDGGGSLDNYNFSALSENQRIDLRPGKGSVILEAKRADIDFGRKAANIYNAFQYENDPRSLIERVEAGSGDDIIVGNKASNRIDGNDGYDIFVIDSYFDDNRFELATQSPTGGELTRYNAADINDTTVYYYDAEGDMTNFRFSVIGPEGMDSLYGIEEIRFKDKTLYLDFAPDHVRITVSYPTGSDYSHDWWDMLPVNHHTGDTRYDIFGNGMMMIFDSESMTGPEFINQTVDQPLYYRIDDKGGENIFNFGSLTGDLRVDLRPGQASVLFDDNRDYLGNNRWAANLYNDDNHDFHIASVSTGYGNDVIVASKGDNFINGGMGYDIVVIDSLFDENVILFGEDDAQWQIGNDGGIFDFSDTRFSISGPEGMDLIGAVEEIRFRDKVIYYSFDQETGQSTIAVEDYMLGSQYDGNWWDKPHISTMSIAELDI